LYFIYILLLSSTLIYFFNAICLSESVVTCHSKAITKKLESIYVNKAIVPIVFYSIISFRHQLYKKII